MEDNDRLLYEYLVNNSQEAYDKLMANNLNLARFTIFKTFSLDNKDSKELLDEYLGVACIGLHNAIIKFDPGKIGKVKFSTFAVPYIQGQLLIERKRNIENSQLLSLDAQFLSEDEDVTLYDFIESEDNNIKDYDNEDYLKYRNKKVIEAIRNLDDFTKQVILYRYGFNGQTPLTQIEIAKIMNTSQTKIANTLAKANERLGFLLNDFSKDYFNSSKKIPIKENILKNFKIDRCIDTYGKDVVEKGILRLSKQEIALVRMYQENKKIDEIMDSLRLNEYATFSMIIDINKKMDLSCRKIIKFSRLENLYKLYGKERIDEMMVFLADRPREILSRYYGLLGYEETSLKGLAKIYDIPSANIAISVDNALKRLEILVNKLFLNEKDVIEGKTKNILYENLWEKLSANYGVLRATELYKKLKDTPKKVIGSYYGLDNHYRLGLEEISKFCNISISEVCSIIRSFYNGSKKLESKSQIKQDIRVLFQEYGEDNVKYVYQSYSENKKRVLDLYYGLNGNHSNTYQEISQITNLSYTNVRKLISNFKIKVKELSVSKTSRKA